MKHATYIISVTTAFEVIIETGIAFPCFRLIGVSMQVT
jgi:hypothetical protein